MNKLNKVALSTLLAATLFSGVTLASDTTGSVSLSSEYLKRGISMSDNDPSIGLGVTHQLNQEFSLGANLNTIDFDNSGVDTEIELFGTYSYDLRKDVSVDLGVSQWMYTGGTDSSELNYTEVFASVSTQGFTVTNRWTNDFLGSDATHTVLEVGYARELSGGTLELDLDWNHTLDDDKLSFNGDSSYVHWRVGYGYMATEDVTLTVAYDGTNGKDDFGGAGDDRLSATVAWAF
jgi:uncharacterized protein (TIGR02001 family)